MRSLFFAVFYFSSSPSTTDQVSFAAQNKSAAEKTKLPKKISIANPRPSPPLDETIETYDIIPPKKTMILTVIITYGNTLKILIKAFFPVLFGFFEEVI